MRPNKFKDIIGQDKVKKSLQISIKSAKEREEPLGHTLIDSQPGYGKTTLAMAIANELGCNTKTILGGNIKSFKDILPTLTNVQPHDILFIDEIHRVNKRIAESLYTVLEDFRIDLPFENDEGEYEIISIDLPKFTVIGATTEVGKLVKPFIDRFKLQFTLSQYSKGEISQLLIKNCEELKVSIENKALDILSVASRGTPRVAISLLEWIRDYAVAHDLKVVTETNLVDALAMREIGRDGSTLNDRRYISFLRKQKVPVGLETIVASTGIDKNTVEYVVEPFLLARGLIKKTNKGRVANERV